ncbi:MAG TPA: hypothetical protein VIU12_04480 [Chryseolinea sp.]
MTLPRGNEYNQAVQVPQISFSDSELKASKVELDKLGLPKPYSGGFTTTYRLQSGSHDWAVRCFTREIQDLQKRYQAINNFLSKTQSKYFVDAKYLPSGIRVAGIEYPVIKMKWLNGEPLNVFLSKNYSTRSIVESLLTDFLRLVKELESFNIAHGDLQHGNILVKNNQMFLIDYDGMFFPELVGLATNEVGHINYQHPQRTARHFSKDIDRFASIIIYIGLKAVSINPSLWKKYDNGENLLFKQSDFADLQNSPLIRDLSVMSDVQPLIERFLGACYLEFEKIPSLSSFISGTFAYPTVKLGNLQRIAITRSQYLVIDGIQKGSILEHVGERVEIVGKVTALRQGHTRYGAPYAMLNMGGSYPSHTFTVVLWSETIRSLQAVGTDPKDYKEQWVSVIGVISQYKGRPQLYIEQLTQMRILSSVQEAQMLLIQKPTIPVSTSSQSQPTSTPKSYPPPPRRTGNKDIDTLIDLYGNRPVTKPTSGQTQRSTGYSSQQPQKNPTPYTSNAQPTNKSNNKGCIVAIVLIVIGGAIGGAISESPGGVAIGAIIGWLASAIFRK